MESVSAQLPVPHAVFKVTMNGKNVTAVLTPYLISVSYADFLEGESDTLDIRVDDAGGRFRGPWYPVKGQTLEIEFGYEGEPLQKAGSFEIDEIEGEGPPDVISIRAVATGVNQPHRTHRSKAYSDTTLASIAHQLASRLKLQVVGDIEPVQIVRITQAHEKDLVFMRRIAEEYGYAFSIKGSQMIFFKRAKLRQSKSVLTLSRIDLTSYRFKDKIMGVVKSAHVAYHYPRKKRLHRYDEQDTDHDVGGDTVALNVRAESVAQAKRKARSALERANENATCLDLTAYGNPKLVAGVNFSLVDMGRFNGVYHIVKSRHDIDHGGGYRTDVEAKRVVDTGKTGVKINV